MKIAFVNQPISLLSVPEGDQPLRGDSISLWNYHVATRLGESVEAHVYTRTRESQAREIKSVNTTFHLILGATDERREAWRRRLQPLTAWLPSDSRKPYYLSEKFYKNYAETAAQDIARQECDVIHVTNFSNMIPVLRRHNPDSKIVVHFQCEWANQLDPKTLAHNISLCDAISGCSEFIAERIRQSFPDQAQKCFSLWNGVDHDLFVPSADTVSTESSEIVFIGRVSPEKGIHTLLQAFEKTAQKINGARITLIGAQFPVPHEFVAAIDPDPLVQQMAHYYHFGKSNTYQDHLNSLIPDDLQGQVSFVSDATQSQVKEDSTHSLP